MIDPKIIRENPEIIREALKLRDDDFDLNRLIEVEALRRYELLIVEGLRAEKNGLSKQIGQAHKDGLHDIIETLKIHVIELNDKIKNREIGLNKVETEFNELMLWLPNIPHLEVPEGKDDSDNVILHEWRPKC